MPEHKKISIPGGVALIGTQKGIIAADGESPLRKQTIKEYLIDNTAVSNERFAAFIDATGYITEAERIGWSYVFYDHLSDGARTEDTLGDAAANWWRQVHGANWKLINGPNSDEAFKQNHPVVHVSHNDAMAFAQWSGGRLPIEAEWEHAARAGQGDVMFPWGNEQPDDESFLPCNIWQGHFPHYNSGADGYPATAPVDAFDANGYGLYNMVGNTWEWTAGPYLVRPKNARARKHGKNMKGTMVLKGGSFMCHRSYCFRYRIAARSGSTPDNTTSHIGFRLVYNV